jgi:hypothetical protein
VPSFIANPSASEGTGGTFRRRDAACHSVLFA